MIPSTNIVVPFKDPTRSKERLADFLSPAERKELAIALFHKTMSVLLSVTPDVLVVTDSFDVKAMAEAIGAKTLLENNARGETEAVAFATQWSVDQGFQRQVVVPADLADLRAEDLTRLLAEAVPAPSVVLVPAVGDDGTNAIMTSPPDALPFRFGKASFAGYLLRAAELSVTARVLRLESFILDVDTPEDLKAFREQLVSQ